MERRALASLDAGRTARENLESAQEKEVQLQHEKEQLHQELAKASAAKAGAAGMSERDAAAPTPRSTERRLVAVSSVLLAPITLLRGGTGAGSSAAARIGSACMNAIESAAPICGRYSWLW